MIFLSGFFLSLACKMGGRAVGLVKAAISCISSMHGYLLDCGVLYNGWLCNEERNYIYPPQPPPSSFPVEANMCEYRFLYLCICIWGKGGCLLTCFIF